MAEMMTEYALAYRHSIEEPEVFWSGAAQSIDWFRPWTTILDDSDAPFYRWFPGAETNTCYNAVDRHVTAGRGDTMALLYESPVTGSRRKFTYRELQSEVARVAGGLKELGVDYGDRVVIYMPMVPEAVFAMLACARIGAVHSVVFGGFAAGELAKRIDHARPKVVLTASCGIEPKGTVPYVPLLERALDASSHRPEHCVVLQREEHLCALEWPGCRDWREWLRDTAETACIPVASEDPLYILYTSGTTGTPKGVVRDNGGHMVALAWSMRHIYDAGTGDVFWAASDIGWVVGHSYIVYGPLLAGCATVLFEGKPVGTPDAGVYWRTIRRYGVKCLFTAPTAIRAIKREDPDGRFLDREAPESLNYLFLAGERADPDTVRWARERLGIPVMDHWWQTETGWPAAGCFAGMGLTEYRIGSAGRPVPGYRIRVLDSHSEVLPAGEIGDIAVQLPLPPGCLSTLWDNDDGYRESYLTKHPGHYTTGDAGYLDEDGFLYVMSRVDDVINVAGHRLSTGALEEILCDHPAVVECAVVGIRDPEKGQVPLAFVILFPGMEPAELKDEINRAVRDNIGPIATLRFVFTVPRLPKTRSGKILRAVLRKIVDGEPYDVPATIDDPAALGEIEDLVVRLPEHEPVAGRRNIDGKT